LWEEGQSPVQDSKEGYLMEIPKISGWKLSFMKFNKHGMRFKKKGFLKSRGS
jgi:hypothetical protein